MQNEIKWQPFLYVLSKLHFLQVYTHHTDNGYHNLLQVNKPNLNKLILMVVFGIRLKAITCMLLQQARQYELPYKMSYHRYRVIEVSIQHSITLEVQCTVKYSCNEITTQCTGKLPCFVSSHYR